MNKYLLTQTTNVSTQNWNIIFFQNHVSGSLFFSSIEFIYKTGCESVTWHKLNKNWCLEGFNLVWTVKLWSFLYQIMIPTNLSEKDFNCYILPHLVFPKFGPKLNVSPYKIFNYILWVRYTRNLVLHTHTICQALFLK